MRRPRHPKKAIEQAVRYAEELGWELRKGRGHAWGRLFCPHGLGGCQVRVASTPRSPDREAQRIRHEVDKCPHQEDIP